MANGYSTGTTTTNTVSSMGAQGLPMSSALPIIVNESTPNLAEIQSFPVVVSGGGIHIHQDPVTGQRYRMTDEFHSRIPQILAGNSNVTGNMMVGGGLTGGQMSSGVLVVGQNLSVSQLKDAPPQPTVEINGVEFKQNPEKTSFKSEDGKTNIVETFNVFPESTSRGTTDINSLLYSQHSVNTSVNYFSRNGFPIPSRFVIPNTKLSTLSSIQPTRPVTNAFSASSNFKNRYVLRIDKKYG